MGELRAADPTKFLIVAVHHPVYSADNDHGGEKKIGIRPSIGPSKWREDKSAGEVIRERAS